MTLSIKLGIDTTHILIQIFKKPYDKMYYTM